MTRTPFILRNVTSRNDMSIQGDSALIEPLPAAVPLEPRLVNFDGGTKMSKARGETTDDE